MGRKVERVSIQADISKRDEGRCYLITEMPASQSEKWGIRAMLALANSGVEVPPNLLDAGMLGVAAIMFQAVVHLRFEQAEPLMDEMFGCIQRVEVRDDRTEFIRALVEEDIEDPKTRLFLRERVLSLHLDFSVADALLRLRDWIASAVLLSTPMSLRPLEPSSPPDSPPSTN